MKQHLKLVEVSLDDLDDLGAPTMAEQERTAQALAALKAERTRRWAYLKLARRARLSTSPRKRKHGERSQFQLTHAEFRLLHALVEFADADLRNSFPGQAQLMQDEGWGKRMLNATLHSLSKKGWIVRFGDEQRITNQFCVPAGAISTYASGWEGPR